MLTRNLTNNNYFCKYSELKKNFYRYCSKIVHVLGVNYYRVNVDFAGNNLKFIIPTLYFDEALINLDHVLCDYGTIVSKKTKPRSGIILDVGAFLGFYTVTSFLVMNNKGYIYSIEPNVHILPFLRENVRLNKVVNTRILSFAICPSSETRKIFIAEYPAVSSMIRDHVEYHSRIVGELEVKCVKLSNLLNYLKYVQILKLDIEGLELDVLKEAFDELQRVEGIIVEVHIDVVDTKEIETVLERAGFNKLFLLTSNEMPNQIIIYAMK